VDTETDHIKGPQDVPLTLVEYGDFECLFCASATGVTRERTAEIPDPSSVFSSAGTPSRHGQRDSPSDLPVSFRCSERWLARLSTGQLPDSCGS
jgi:hypothetical protein